MTDMVEMIDHGDELEMVVHLHKGQKKALKSDKRYVVVLAGTQSGKTSFGPYWMYEEIQKRGPGDYLIATPTFPLLELKLLPEFKAYFIRRLNLGTYKASPVRLFTVSKEGERTLFGSEQETPTQIFFGHAQDPESLESATFKAAWLDEAGQKKFKYGSWEAIQRRLSIHQGRVLMTTTPYTLGWLKNKMHDPAKKGDPNIELIQFKSTMNPVFPKEEYEKQKAELPSWRFNMMYNGLFERPAGMIYDCFDDHHKVPRFEIPDSWNKFGGLDFGGVNTACVYLAQKPDTNEYYLYKTYHGGNLTAAKHADKIKSEVGGSRFTVYGGAKSEGQWRDEFKAGGLMVHEPLVSDVEVGINRVYSLFQKNQLFVFDDLDDMIDELESYSRVLDDDQNPTEKIEDKNKYHRLDGLRYIGTFLNRGSSWLVS